MVAFSLDWFIKSTNHRAVAEHQYSPESCLRRKRQAMETKLYSGGGDHVVVEGAMKKKTKKTLGRIIAAAYLKKKKKWHTTFSVSEASDIE